MNGDPDVIVPGAAGLLAEGQTLPPTAEFDRSTSPPPSAKRTDGETIRSSTDATAVAATQSLRQFGDYELLEEIARGGMGVVYRARQRRLNRTVALKMILAGELASADDVQRFLCEAEAAAGLDHPGIVPVYECGTVGDQHYFSMGFVEGESLGTRLAAGPLPPREAAEIVAAVADAVDYAHTRGIIHRDLKPANILLDRDGRPRVTDFGLAKRVSGDSGLTRTGQAMGTPSYMPPEQAAGRLAEVGPASDVYSLGAVLYASLTGRPPFQAASALETLLQVLEEEPVPPRQLNPNVPGELETITLKCLQREAARRYRTARDLADELRRFLSGEPILARPVGRLQRGWRWCRRNPKLAVLTAAVFVLLATVAVGSTAAAVRIRHERDRTEKARTKADENFRNAEAQRQIAQTAQQEALRNLATAKTERQRAEVNFLKAREAVDRMLTRVGQQRLSGVPQMEPVRRALLEDAVEFYRGFLDENSNDRAVRAETARAYQRLADIYHTLGQVDQGRRAVERGAAIFDKLAEEFPDEGEYRAGSAKSLNQSGLLFKDEMNAAEAERAYGGAAAILERLVEDFPDDPDYRVTLSQTKCNLGVLRELTGRFGLAEEAYRGAIRLDEELVRRWPAAPHGRYHLSENCGNLERLLGLKGQLAEAESLAVRSCEIGEKLIADFPAVAEYQNSLGKEYHNLGVLLDETGRRDQAEQFFRKAVELHQRLANDYPHVVEYRQDLASHYNSLGMVLAAAGNQEEAETAFSQAIALKEKLAADLPSVPMLSRQLANSFTSLGLFYLRFGQFDKAVQANERGIKILEQLVERYPAVPEYPSALGAALNNLAMVMSHRDSQAARELVEKAIEYQQAAIKLNPQEKKFHEFLRNHQSVLAGILVQLGQHAHAARAAMSLADSSVDPANDHYNAACYLARCVSLANLDATLPLEQRTALAEDYVLRALSQLKLSIAAGYMDFDHMRQDNDLTALRDRDEFRKLLDGGQGPKRDK
jgi:eukaryotic-like serine/threonine-protein kinase